MKKKARVLFISQEITPYLPETHIGKIARALPQGTQERGKEIRLFMPRYGNINERRHQLHEVIRLSGMNLIINDTDHPLIIKVASLPAARMQVYFIDNEEFFQRKFVHHDANNKFFSDNDERAIFFCRGVIETVKKLGWQPDIIHCHGWMTSLVPLYIKKAFADEPMFSEAKVIYSVYSDDEFEKPLSKDFTTKCMLDGINKADVKIGTDATYTAVSKLAIQHADAVILGSEKVNPDVTKYIKSSGKPFIAYQGEENYMDAFNTFYDEVLEDAGVIA